MESHSYLNHHGTTLYIWKKNKSKTNKNETEIKHFRKKTKEKWPYLL